MPELNKEQEEAASFVEGVAAVIAVPGSGKTLTMTRTSSMGGNEVVRKTIYDKK